jgi:hypothetical protein
VPLLPSGEPYAGLTCLCNRPREHRLLLLRAGDTGLSRVVSRGPPVLLSENNIKSELSYAYLHAVAARAGLGCHATDRHTDGAGVDAVLRARERFDPAEWLALSEEALVAKRCAYWMSLFGAPDGAQTGNTVYLPRQNVLAVESLRKLMTAFSLGQRPLYAR